VLAKLTQNVFKNKPFLLFCNATQYKEIK